MKIHLKQTFVLLLLLPLLGLMGGCAGLERYRSPDVPQLTPEQETRLGEAVEGRLIQLLGGPYHDKSLQDDLGRLSKPFIRFVLVADRGQAEIYPLPGQRLIVSRGLLTQVRTRAELNGLLQHAATLARTAYADRGSYKLARATQDFLAGRETLYDPNSADIRLARIFAEHPCAGTCISSTQAAGDGGQLPMSVRRLKDLEQGYLMLAKARSFESSGEQGQAIKTYLQAATVAPDESRILGALGMAYLRAGQIQPAHLHLQRAGRLQPDYYRTQMGLGYLYLQLGKFSQAQTALAESVRLLPVTENLFLLAEASEKSGDLTGAMSLYRLVAETDRSSKLGQTAAERLKRAKGAE